jgi:hypothetical protein
MTDTIIYIGNRANNTGLAPWDDNDFTAANATTLGVIKADLIDSTGAASGISYENTIVANAATGVGGAATSSAGGWPIEVLSYHWRTSNGGTSEIEFALLTAGDTCSLELAGHQGSGRDTDFTVNGVTQTYVDSGTATPTAPITFAITVPADGKITVSYTKAVTGGQYYGHLNGSKLTITPAATSATVSTSDIPFNEPAGWDYVAVVTGSVDTASTDSVYYNDPNTGLTGAQYVYENVTSPSSIAITAISEEGYITLASAPSVTQTFDGYVIESDGTVRTTNTFTISLVVAAATTGVVTSIIQSATKNVVTSVI